MVDESLFFMNTQLKNLHFRPPVVVTTSKVLRMMNRKEFFEYLDTKNYTDAHSKRLKRFFYRFFIGMEFNSPFELQKYILMSSKSYKYIVNCARVYLNFCEMYELVDDKTINSYRKVLIFKKTNPDVYVPPNTDVVNNYFLVSHHESLKLVYMVLMTSGVRICEAVWFLNNFSSFKPIVRDNFVYYVFNMRRNSKNLNNIYLPIWVHTKLKDINNTYTALHTRYNEFNPSFSLKYLRKWHYNFLLYSNVPESVVDFIQGRSSKTVGSNHYMAKNQQAEHWYGIISDKLQKMFSEFNLFGYQQQNLQSYLRYKY